MIQVGVGHPTVGGVAASHGQVSTGHQHQITPEGSGFQISIIENRCLEGIIRAISGQGSGSNKNLGGGSGYEEFLGVLTKEDFAGILILYQNAPGGLFIGGRVNGAVNSHGQVGNITRSGIINFLGGYETFRSR